MPDISNFVIPESRYDGLYKTGDDLARKAERDAANKASEKAHRDANAKASMLDAKDYLSGSKYDQVTNQLIGSANKAALEAAQSGASYNDILMRTAPYVNQAVSYMANGKSFNEQKKLALEQANKMPGVSPELVEKRMNEMAFPTDPNTGEVDVTKYNPNKDYYSEVLDKGDVYNAEAFDNIFKDTPLFKSNTTAKRVNSKGGYEQKQIDIEHKPYEIPNIDPKTGRIDEGNPFIPKYQVVRDGDVDVMHPENKEPVRILDEGLFNSLANDDKYKAAINYSMQEAKKNLVGKTDQNGKEILDNDPRVKIMAQRIAFEELNAPQRRGGTVKNKDIVKENPAPHVSIRVNTSKSGDDVKVNDIWGRINDKVDQTITEKGKDAAVLMNDLDSDEQEIILALAQKNYKPDAANLEKPLDLTNTFIFKDDDGKIALYRTEEDGRKNAIQRNRVMTLPKVGLNMKVQPNSKAKVEVVRQGNPSETPASNGYTKDQLKGAGWSDDQINQAVKAGKITLR